MPEKPDPDIKSRELLVAADKQAFVRSYFHDDEPDLVPEGCYAVVSVRFVEFTTLVLSQEHAIAE